MAESLLNMGQIAPGGDKQGNSRLFSQPSQSSGCWTIASQTVLILRAARVYRDISLNLF